MATRRVNCLWLVGITLIFDSTPQIKVQRCQIAVSRWPNDIISAVIMRSSKTGRKTSKPNVINILLLNFCEQKFVQHAPITIAIDCNGLSLVIFEEKCPNYASGPKPVPNSDSFSVRRLFSVCVRVFCAPNATILLVYIAVKMSFIWKDDFFFCQNRHFL